MKREYERVGIMERLIRLEEEPKAQRELIDFGALAMLITVFKFVG